MLRIGQTMLLRRAFLPCDVYARSFLFIGADYFGLCNHHRVLVIRTTLIIYLESYSLFTENLLQQLDHTRAKRFNARNVRTVGGNPPRRRHFHAYDAPGGA